MFPTGPNLRHLPLMVLQLDLGHKETTQHSQLEEKLEEPKIGVLVGSFVTDIVLLQLGSAWLGQPSRVEIQQFRKNNQ